jgi:hypothetical protein
MVDGSTLMSAGGTLMVDSYNLTVGSGTLMSDGQH